jgi:hypothetical protein
MSRKATVRFHTIALLLIAACLWQPQLQAEELDATTPPEGITRSYLSGREQRFGMKVHIWGEVQKPGLYEVPDDTDLIELISKSGGPTEYANLRNVSISRTNHRGRELEKINVLEALKENNRGVSAPLLKPGDTVMVSRNKTYAWRTMIRTFSEISLIVSTYILIYDRVK